MANPSLYKPRRTIPPETGPEVDTSVNWLVGGIVALALLLVSLIGMIGYSKMTMQRPSLIRPSESEARPDDSAGDITVPAGPAPAGSPRR